MTTRAAAASLAILWMLVACAPGALAVTLEAEASKESLPAPAANTATLSPEFETKLHQLMEAEGAPERMRKQLADAELRARSSGERMVRDAAARLQVPADKRGAFEAAVDQFVTEVLDALKAEVQGEAWLQVYRERFSEAEIDALLAFYQSPVVAKEREVRTLADQQLEDEITTRFGRKSVEPSKRLLRHLRTLVRECQCERPGAAMRDAASQAQ